MLTIPRAKQQLLDSITKYRALSVPLTPNSDNVDWALTEALQRATTWQQVGVIAASLPARMGLLQKPIVPQESYKDSIAMRFDEGRFGWYWQYAATPDCQTGFLVCVFRYPTTEKSTDSHDSIFSVCGYVVDNGTFRPFGTLDGPIMCPGIQTTDDKGDLVLTLDLNASADDPAVNIETIVMSGPAADFKVITTRIGFKTGVRNYTYTLASESDAVFEGPKGCSPTCAGGAGTSYWSFTYMTGAGTADGYAGAPAPASVTPTPVLIGWFDHQWANFVPRSVILRAIANAFAVAKAAVRTAWIFLTLQVSPELQYSVSYTAFKSQDEIANVRVGSVFSAEANVFRSGVEPQYNVPATITIMGFSANDARLPDDVQVTVEGTTYRLKAAVDGRIVLPDASVNLEALSVLSNDTGAPIGIGCIEITGFHNVDDDIRRMEAVTGINAPVSYFEPQAESKKTSAESILLIIAIIFGVIIALSLIIAGIVALVKRARKPAALGSS